MTFSPCARAASEDPVSNIASIVRENSFFSWTKDNLLSAFTSSLQRGTTGKLRLVFSGAQSSFSTPDTKSVVETTSIDVVVYQFSTESGASDERKTHEVIWRRKHAQTIFLTRIVRFLVAERPSLLRVSLPAARRTVHGLWLFSLRGLVPRGRRDIRRASIE